MRGALLVLLSAITLGAAGAEFADGPLKARLDLSATTLRCGESLVVTLAVESPAAAQLSLTPADPGGDELVVMDAHADTPRWLPSDRILNTWRWTLCAGLPGTVTIPAFTVFSDAPQETRRLSTAPLTLTVTSVLSGSEPDEQLRPLAAARPAPTHRITAPVLVALVFALAGVGWLVVRRRRTNRHVTTPAPSPRQVLEQVLGDVERHGRVESRHWRTLRDLLPASLESQELHRRFIAQRYAHGDDAQAFLTLGRETASQLDRQRP